MIGTINLLLLLLVSILSCRHPREQDISQRNKNNQSQEDKPSAVPKSIKDHELFPVSRNLVWDASWCWMSSALQVFVQIDVMTSFAQNKKQDFTGNLEKKLADLVLEMRSPGETQVNPAKFYSVLVDYLEDNSPLRFRGCASDPWFFYQLFVKDYLLNLDNFIDFQSEFLLYAWAFPNRFEQNSVNDLFNKFSNFKLPKYFFVNLGPNNNKQNLVPLLLEITKKEEKKLYELFGMIFAGKGHATALVKQKNNEWYYYDDLSNIREELSEKDMQLFSSSNNYKGHKGAMLFYRSK
jgi:hypothetical protein